VLPENGSLRIFDAQGTVLYAENITPGQTIPGAYLKEGNYIQVSGARLAPASKTSGKVLVSFRDVAEVISDAGVRVKYTSPIWENVTKTVNGVLSPGAATARQFDELASYIQKQTGVSAENLESLLTSVTKNTPSSSTYKIEFNGRFDLEKRAFVYDTIELDATKPIDASVLDRLKGTSQVRMTDTSGTTRLFIADGGGSSAFHERYIPKLDTLTDPVAKDAAGNPLTYQRIQVPDGANEALTKQIQDFNSLIDRFEQAYHAVDKNFFHMRKEQLELLMSSENILQLGAGSGKTTIIGPMIAAIERNSIFTLPSSSDATDFVNQIAKKSMRSFYDTEGITPVFYDNQRGFLEVTENFNRRTARKVDDATMKRLALLAKDDPTTHGLMVITESSDHAWGYIRGRDGNGDFASTLLYQMSMGKQYTNGRGYTVVSDEVGAVINGQFSVTSGTPTALKNLIDQSALMGLADGQQIIKISNEVNSSASLQAFREQVLKRIQQIREKGCLVSGCDMSSILDDLFYTYTKNNMKYRLPIPKDEKIIFDSYGELIDQALKNPDLPADAPIRKLFTDIRTKFATGEGGYDALQSEFDTLLRSGAGQIDGSFDVNKALLADIAYRKNDLEARWFILSQTPGNNYGQEGAEIVLRRMGGTTGEQYSSISQQVALQTEGPALLEAAGIPLNRSVLKSIDDISITPKSSQVSTVDILNKTERYIGYDATPDTAARKLGVLATGASERPPDPTRFMQSTSQDDLIRQVVAAEKRAKTFATKAHAFVLIDDGVTFGTTTDGLIQAYDGAQVVARTKFITDPNGGVHTEYYIERIIRYSNGNFERVATPIGSLDEWNGAVKELLEGGQPQDLLIVYEGRARAVDLKVLPESKNIRWNVVANDTNTMEDITQAFKRNRVPAQQSDLIANRGWTPDDVKSASEYTLLVRTDNTSLTKTNIIDHYKSVLDDAIGKTSVESRLTKIAEFQTNALTIAKNELLKTVDVKDQTSLTKQLDALIQDAERVKQLQIQSISKTPLQGEAIGKEVWTRGKESYASLENTLKQLTDSYHLDADQVKTVKVAFGLQDSGYITFEEFTTMWKNPVKTMPAPGAGPLAEVTYFAQTTHPDMMPQALFHGSSDPSVVKKAATTTTAVAKRTSTAARYPFTPKAKISTALAIAKRIGLTTVLSKTEQFNLLSGYAAFVKATDGVQQATDAVTQARQEAATFVEQITQAGRLTVNDVIVGVDATGEMRRIPVVSGAVVRWTDQSGTPVEKTINKFIQIDTAVGEVVIDTNGERFTVPSDEVSQIIKTTGQVTPVVLATNITQAEQALLDAQKQLDEFVGDDGTTLNNAVKQTITKSLTAALGNIQPSDAVITKTISYIAAVASGNETGRGDFEKVIQTYINQHNGASGQKITVTAPQVVDAMTAPYHAEYVASASEAFLPKDVSGDVKNKLIKTLIKYVNKAASSSIPPIGVIEQWKTSRKYINALNRLWKATAGDGKQYVKILTALLPDMVRAGDDIDAVVTLLNQASNNAQTPPKRSEPITPSVPAAPVTSGSVVIEEPVNVTILPGVVEVATFDEVQAFHSRLVGAYPDNAWPDKMTPGGMYRKITDVDGSIVGIAVLVNDPNTTSTLLDLLLIDPKRQQEGFGSKMITAIQETLERNTLWLLASPLGLPKTVGANTTAAQDAANKLFDFYRKHGFVSNTTNQSGVTVATFEWNRPPIQPVGVTQPQNAAASKPDAKVVQAQQEEAALKAARDEFAALTTTAEKINANLPVDARVTLPTIVSTDLDSIKQGIKTLTNELVTVLRKQYAELGAKYKEKTGKNAPAIQRNPSIVDVQKAIEQLQIEYAKPVKQAVAKTPKVQPAGTKTATPSWIATMTKPLSTAWKWFNTFTVNRNNVFTRTLNAKPNQKQYWWSRVPLLLSALIPGVNTITTPVIIATAVYDGARALNAIIPKIIHSIQTGVSVVKAAPKQPAALWQLIKQVDIKQGFTDLSTNRNNILMSTFNATAVQKRYWISRAALAMVSAFWPPAWVVTGPLLIYDISRTVNWFVTGAPVLAGGTPTKSTSIFYRTDLRVNLFGLKLGSFLNVTPQNQRGLWWTTRIGSLILFTLNFNPVFLVPIGYDIGRVIYDAVRGQPMFFKNPESWMPMKTPSSGGQQATPAAGSVQPAGGTADTPRALTTNEVTLLRNGAKSAAHPELTRELLNDTRFFPKDAITIDGRTFYLSSIIQTPKYKQAIMYTQLPDGRIVPRVLYKSNSDGGWRSTPGYEGWSGIYSKGIGVSYTQETKPHEAINRYFNTSNYIVTSQENVIKTKFNYVELQGDPSQPISRINTFTDEQKIYDDTGVLQEMQKYPPGTYSKSVNHQGVQYDGMSFTKAFRTMDFQAPELSGFVPNFHLAPETVEKSNHTLLGEITLETYEGVLQGRPVKWVMAYDAKGRTWVDRIYFADSKINSYGVYDEIINSGALTNKPLEYRSQAAQLQPKTEYVDYDKTYVDITPLLANLFPIREFNAAKNITRTTQGQRVSSIKLQRDVPQELKKEDFSIDNPATIGRQSGNTLQLSGFAQVSRIHLSTYYDNDAWWYVDDLGSTNGTRVDGIAIQPNIPKQLTGGAHTLLLGNQANLEIVIDAQSKNMTITLKNDANNTVQPSVVGKKTCSDCSVVVPTVMNLLDKGQTSQAKAYLDHYFANQPVFDALNAHVEASEAVQKPTQAEKDDALQAVQKAIDTIRRALQDSSLVAEDREKYLADLEQMHYIADFLDLLEVAPSSWTEYVSVGATNTANATRRWANTGKNIILDQAAGGGETQQPIAPKQPSVQAVRNPTIDTAQMQVGGMEYTHIESSIAQLMRYGQRNGVRSQPQFVNATTGRPYWVENPTYQPLLAQMDAGKSGLDAKVEEAQQILADNHIWGQSITGVFSNSSEYVDGLHSILNFGLRSKENEPPWIGGFAKTGIGASAGDFFHGYAALIVLPEGVKIEDVFVEDPILHQKFIPSDYLLYVLKTPEEARLFSSLINGDAFLSLGWYPPGTDVYSWTQSRVISLEDIITHKDDLTALSPIHNYVSARNDSNTKTPLDTTQIPAIVKEIWGAQAGNELTRLERTNDFIALVKQSEKYKALMAGRSPTVDESTAIDTAIRSAFQSLQQPSSIVLNSSLPGLPQLATWLGPRLENIFPWMTKFQDVNLFDTLRNSLSRIIQPETEEQVVETGFDERAVTQNSSVPSANALPKETMLPSLTNDIAYYQQNQSPIGDYLIHDDTLIQPQKDVNAKITPEEYEQETYAFKVLSRAAGFYELSDPRVVGLQQELDKLWTMVNNERQEQGKAPLPHPRLLITVNQKNPNAVSYPDGTIMVNQQIINLMPTKDALMAVLVHEYSHFEDKFDGIVNKVENKKYDNTQVLSAQLGNAFGLRLGEYKGDVVGQRLAKLNYHSLAGRTMLQALQVYYQRSSADLTHGSTILRQISQLLQAKWIDFGSTKTTEEPIISSWKRPIRRDMLDVFSAAPSDAFPGLLKTNRIDPILLGSIYGRVNDVIYARLRWYERPFFEWTLRFNKKFKNDWIASVKKTTALFHHIQMAYPSVDARQVHGLLLNNQPNGFYSWVVQLNANPLNRILTRDVLDSPLFDYKYYFQPAIIDTMKDSAATTFKTLFGFRDGILEGRVTTLYSHVVNLYEAPNIRSYFLGHTQRFSWKAYVNRDQHEYEQLQHTIERIDYLKPTHAKVDISLGFRLERLFVPHFIQMISRRQPDHVFITIKKQLRNEDGKFDARYHESMIDILYAYTKANLPFVLQDKTEKERVQLAISSLFDRVISRNVINVPERIQLQYEESILERFGFTTDNVLLQFSRAVTRGDRNTVRSLMRKINPDQLYELLQEDNISLRNKAMLRSEMRRAIGIDGSAWVSSSAYSVNDFTWELAVLSVLHNFDWPLDKRPNQKKNVDLFMSQRAAALDSFDDKSLIDVAKALRRAGVTTIYPFYEAYKARIMHDVTSGTMTIEDGYTNLSKILQFNRGPFYRLVGNIPEDILYLADISNMVLGKLEQNYAQIEPFAYTSAVAYFDLLEQTFSAGDTKNRIMQGVAEFIIKNAAYGEAKTFVMNHPDLRFELIPLLLTYHGREVDEGRDLYQAFQEAVDKSVETSTKADYGGGLVVLDTLFDVALKEYPEIGWSFFHGAVTGDFNEVVQTVAKAYYRAEMSSEFKSANKRYGVLSLSQVLDLLYSLKPTEKTLLLTKILTAPAGGVLVETDSRNKIEQLLNQKISGSGRTKEIFNASLHWLLSNKKELDKAALAVINLVNNQFLTNKPNTSPVFGIINASVWTAIREDGTGRMERFMATVYKFAWLKGFVQSIPRVYDYIQSQHEKTYTNPRTAATVAREKTLTNQLEKRFAKPRGKSQYTGGDTISATSAVLEVAKALGGVGTRFLQVLGQYVELTEEQRRDFAKANDSASELYMVNLFQSMDAAILDIDRRIAEALSLQDNETVLQLQKEKNDISLLAEDVHVEQRLGGGSIMTAYLVTRKSTGQKQVIKLLNPNLQPQLKKDVEFVRSLLQDLQKSDKGHAEDFFIAERMLDMIDVWMTEDIHDETFLRYDGVYAAAHETSVATNGIHVGVSQSGLPNNMYVKVDEYVEGVTLNKLMTEQGGAVARPYVIAIVEDYIRTLLSPVTIDGTPEIVVHSDLHPGNVMIKPDGSVALIDRNYYLRLAESDRALISLLFMPDESVVVTKQNWIQRIFNQFGMEKVVSGLKKVDSLVQFFVSLPENTKLAAYQNAIRQDVLSALLRSSKKDGFTVMNILFQVLDKYAAKAGMEESVPIRYRILFKNLISINGMLQSVNGPSVQEVAGQMQLTTAVLLTQKPLLERVDFTSADAPQAVQKIVEEEYERLHPGLSPPAEVVSQVVAAILSTYPSSLLPQQSSPTSVTPQSTKTQTPLPSEDIASLLSVVSAVVWDGRVNEFRNTRTGQFVRSVIDPSLYTRDTNGQWVDMKTGKTADTTDVIQNETQGLVRQLRVESGSEEAFAKAIVNQFGVSVASWNALSLDQKALLRASQFETARSGYEAVKSTYFGSLPKTFSEKLTGTTAKIWSATANFRRMPQDLLVRLRVLFQPHLATALQTKTVNATVLSRNTLMENPQFTALLQQATLEGNKKALQTMKNLLDREVMKEVNAENVLMLSGISTEELAVIVSSLGHNPWVFLSDNRGETSRIVIDNALIDGKHPLAAEGVLDGLSAAEKEKELSYWQKMFPNIPSWLQWLTIAKWSVSRNHSVVHTVTVGGKTYHFLTMHVDPKNGVTFVKDIWNKITGVKDTDRNMFAYHAMEAGTGKSYVGTGLYNLGQKLFIGQLQQAKAQGIIGNVEVIGEEQYKTTGTISGDDPITWKISDMVKAETEVKKQQTSASTQSQGTIVSGSLPGLPQLAAWLGPKLEKAFPWMTKLQDMNLFDAVRNGLNRKESITQESKTPILEQGDENLSVVQVESQSIAEFRHHLGLPTTMNYLAIEKQLAERKKVADQLVYADMRSDKTSEGFITQNRKNLKQAEKRNPLSWFKKLQYMARLSLQGISYGSVLVDFIEHEEYYGYTAIFENKPLLQALQSAPHLGTAIQRYQELRGQRIYIPGYIGSWSDEFKQFLLKVANIPEQQYRQAIADLNHYPSFLFGEDIVSNKQAQDTLLILLERGGLTDVQKQYFDDVEWIISVFSARHGSSAVIYARNLDIPPYIEGVTQERAKRASLIRYIFEQYIGNGGDYTNNFYDLYNAVSTEQLENTVLQLQSGMVFETDELVLPKSSKDVDITALQALFEFAGVPLAPNDVSVASINAVQNTVSTIVEMLVKSPEELQALREKFRVDPINTAYIGLHALASQRQFNIDYSMGENDPKWQHTQLFFTRFLAKIDQISETQKIGLIQYANTQKLLTYAALTDPQVVPYLTPTLSPLFYQIIERMNGEQVWRVRDYLVENRNKWDVYVSKEGELTQQLLIDFFKKDMTKIDYDTMIALQNTISDSFLNALTDDNDRAYWQAIKTNNQYYFRWFFLDTFETRHTYIRSGALQSTVLSSFFQFLQSKGLTEKFTDIEWFRKVVTELLKQPIQDTNEQVALSILQKAHGIPIVIALLADLAGERTYIQNGIPQPSFARKYFEQMSLIQRLTNNDFVYKDEFDVINSIFSDEVLASYPPFERELYAFLKTLQDRVLINFYIQQQQNFSSFWKQGKIDTLAVMRALAQDTYPSDQQSLYQSRIPRYIHHDLALSYPQGSKELRFTTFLQALVSSIEEGYKQMYISTFLLRHFDDFDTLFPNGIPTKQAFLLALQELSDPHVFQSVYEAFTEQFGSIGIDEDMVAVWSMTANITDETMRNVFLPYLTSGREHDVIQNGVLSETILDILAHTIANDPSEKERTYSFNSSLEAILPYAPSTITTQELEQWKSVFWKTVLALRSDSNEELFLFQKYSVFSQYVMGPEYTLSPEFFYDFLQAYPFVGTNMILRDHFISFFTSHIPSFSAVDQSFSRMLLVLLNDEKQRMLPEIIKNYPSTKQTLCYTTDSCSLPSSMLYAALGEANNMEVLNTLWNEHYIAPSTTAFGTSEDVVFWQAYFAQDSNEKKSVFFRPKVNNFLLSKKDQYPRYFDNNAFTAAFYQDLIAENPSEFIAIADKPTWIKTFGEERIKKLLSVLPGGQADEKRNAFTHNAYDRTSQFFQYAVTQWPNDFTLTSDDLDIIIPFIQQFGLSKTTGIFHFYKNLSLYEQGKLSQLPSDIQATGITTISALEERFNSIKTKVFGENPFTDTSNLASFEQDILSLVTMHSVHRWTIVPITQLANTVETGYRSGTIEPLKQEYTTKTIKVPLLADLPQETKSESYEVFRKEILASLDDPTNISDIREQITQVFLWKIEDLRQSADPSKSSYPFIQKQIQYVETVVTQLKAATTIDQLIGILVKENVKQYGEKEKELGSLIRQLAFRKLFIVHQRSEGWIEEIHSLLEAPMSIPAISEVVSIVDNYIKDHVLNIQTENQEGYWDPETFMLLKDYKKKNDINNLFLSHLDELRKILYSMQTAEARGSVVVEMIPDRGLIGEMAGYLGGVCYTKVCPLLSTYPNVTPYKFVAVDAETQEKRLLGSALVFEVTDIDGNSVMVIRAFDVREEQTMKINVFFEQFVDLLQDVAKKRGIKKILAAGTGGTISNYPNTTNYVLSTYVTGKQSTPLKDPFVFNGYDITKQMYVVRSLMVEDTLLLDSLKNPDCYADARIRGVVYAKEADSVNSGCPVGLSMSPVRWLKAYVTDPKLAIGGLQQDITRWSAGIGLGAILTKASLAITNLSFVEGGYTRFLDKFAQYIGPSVYINPNYWRWNFIDYAFGIVSAGLAYGALTLGLSKLFPKGKHTRLLAVVGTILVTTLFSYLGEQYGSITPFKGALLDPNDWLNEFGGMGTFLAAEYVFSLIKQRGISLTGRLFSSNLRSSLRTFLFFAGVGVVGYVSGISLVYFLKLLGL